MCAVRLDSRTCLSTVQPSTIGMARSSTSASGVSSVVLFSPLRPSAAVNTVQPFERRYSEYMRRAWVSSSMTITAGASSVRRLLAIVWSALPSFAFRDDWLQRCCHHLLSLGIETPRSPLQCGVRHLKELVLMVRPSSSASAFLSALACSALLFVSVRAQQPPAPAAQPPAPRPPEEGRGGQGGAPPAGQPAAPPAKPLIPVATNTVNTNPDAYYGQGVTITAALHQVLSKSPFDVDQRRVAGAPAPSKPTDVLVLVPNLQSPVDPKSYVTVMGELVKFDPAEVAKKAKDYKIDLPPDAIAKYTGRPALIATPGITAKFVHLSKPLPAPMTADEETLSKVMKQLPPALAALRTA